MAIGNRVRALLVATTAGSLLVATRRRRRGPREVAQEGTGKARRAARRLRRR